MPVVVRGIGSIQAYNTVTVKSRVDGNILKVAFTEGQFVHQGDLLIQIDPRPYQAQLEQAEANKAKDQANLANAQRDLARYAAIVSNQLAVTRQQYDTQRATVQQLEATLESDQAQIDPAKLNVAYCAITHRSTASPASDSSMSATWYKRALPCRSSSSLKSSRST
jgi:multidrug efflux system membrane fusion protein